MSEVQVAPPKTPRKSIKKKRIAKLTAANVDRWQERLYLENLPDLVQNGYKQLIKKLKSGDPKVLGMALEIANLYKPRSGQVNVVTQIYNKNGGGDSVASQKAQSFESILRRLEISDGSEDASVRPQASDTVIDI